MSSWMLAEPQKPAFPLDRSLGSIFVLAPRFWNREANTCFLPENYQGMWEAGWRGQRGHGGNFPLFGCDNWAARPLHNVPLLQGNVKNSTQKGGQEG